MTIGLDTNLYVKHILSNPSELKCKKLSDLINVVIADDEARSVENLALLLQDFCPSVNLMGKASTIEDTERLIGELKPDLVFLDIQMGSRTIFELLNKLQEINFEIIFITAFENYAIQAFKYMAIDYLLKPVDIKELIASIERAKKNLKKRNFAAHYKNYISTTEREFKPQKISLPTSTGYRFLEIDSIICCIANGSYSEVIMEDGTKMMVSKNLKYHEDLLKDFQFFRVHKSSLINLRKVKSLNRTDGGFIEMNNGDQIYYSKYKRNQLIELLGRV